jgi:hypothetical protein
MERPERIVLIIIGALCERWNVMAPALWVLAVLSTITVIHRIYYTYQQTNLRAPLPTTAPSPGARAVTALASGSPDGTPNP